MSRLNNPRSTSGASLARLFFGAMLAFATMATQAASPVSCPAHDPVPFCDIEDIVPPTGVSQLIYAPNHGVLVLKNSASAIATIDLTTHDVSLRYANSYFTNMTVSPSGRYVFAADYGGESGYGTPYSTNYVHRLDLQTMTWEIKTAYVAYYIQAVSDEQVLLASVEQWITFTDDVWGDGAAVTLMNTPSDPLGRPVYYPGVYSGDFRYAPTSGRLLHATAGEGPSNEIQAFTLDNYEFVEREGTGFQGSASGYAGNAVMATDESGFYLGELEVDTLDVTHTLRIFPQRINAASGEIAFGNGYYYYAHTAERAGYLGFPTTVYGLNAGGSDFWTFDASQNVLRHFVLDDGIFADTFGD